MSVYENAIPFEKVRELSDRIIENNYISYDDYIKYNVKRGLRNADGTGVMAGITRVSSVDGYYIEDGEKIPKEGRLMIRGYSLDDIVDACKKENRFGYEEISFLLLTGSLPTESELASYRKILAQCRELPEDFIEDMIMKAPSPDIMNKLARSVLALYSFDETPDDTSLENTLRQCIHLIAKLPAIMVYAYQVKRRHYYHKSMYIHQMKEEHSTAQTILRSIRADKAFTDEEARLLDICLMVQAEHGGGNCSTFATRVLTSSGTDTYSAIAAGIGALKGPKHGGANAKVSEMVSFIKEGVDDITNEGQVADFLKKIINKEAGDRTGLVYGMGHAVYTLSDPRAKILSREAGEFAKGKDFEEEMILLNLIERLTPEIFAKEKGSSKAMCANLDLYSGLAYKMLRIPEDLFTPVFTIARISGWSAHRIEELLTGNRIIRPAYKSMNSKLEYIPISSR